MSALHAFARLRRLSDPVGCFLSVLWAIGTTTGFTCLGVLVGTGLDDPRANSPALTIPDAAPEAA